MGDEINEKPMTVTFEADDDVNGRIVIATFRLRPQVGGGVDMDDYLDAEMDVPLCLTYQSMEVDGTGPAVITIYDMEALVDAYRRYMAGLPTYQKPGG